ncbi:MAG: hypothetical protein NZ741_11220 [Armatimonadetes bacterium]|nr:hypothetical protein [Armatimonadota bacterium]
MSWRTVGVFVPVLLSAASAGQLQFQEKVSYGGWANCVRLSNGRMELIVTTDVGPRVIRCGFVGGQNLFHEFPNDRGKTGGTEWRPYGGHRLWHAPEQMPRTYAPDNEPVQYHWDGKTLTLTQAVEASTGIVKQIEVTLSPDREHVKLVHRLVNKNLWDIEAAPWCLTFMAQGGQAILPQEPYIPHSQYLLPARPLVLWHYTDMRDPRWTWGTKYIQLRQDPTVAPDDRGKQKIGMLNKQGWAAYVLKGEVFLKRYAYDPNATYPDYGCNTEVFTNADMLELETLGPLSKIPAGGSVEHVEHWFLFKADVGEEETDIDAKLLPLVRQTEGVVK